jgi:ABC-type Fe3+-hydroxamate transport system substrate-binding protein
MPSSVSTQRNASSHEASGWYAWHVLTSRSGRWPTFLVFVIAATCVSLGVWKALSAPDAAAPPRPGSPRIVVLSPAIAIILRDLGLAPRIVGRHGFDLALDKSIPVCGDQSGVDYEAVVRAHPTHLLMEAGAAGIPARLADLAARGGWEVQSYPMLTLDDIRDCTRRVALTFGVDAAPILSRMDAAWSLRDNLYQGRVLLLAAVDPPSALGPGSFHYQILQRLGGAPAITEGSPYITLSTEDVLRLRPDAILLILPRSPTDPARTATAMPGELIALLGRVGTLDIPAIRDHRVALIDSPLAHTPSTAMIGLADEIAGVLEAWNRARSASDGS